MVATPYIYLNATPPSSGPVVDGIPEPIIAYMHPTLCVPAPPQSKVNPIPNPIQWVKIAMPIADSILEFILQLRVLIAVLEGSLLTWRTLPTSPFTIYKIIYSLMSTTHGLSTLIDPH